MTGIFVGLKFENVNYSSEINHADAQTSNTSTRRWFYYIITKIHPPISKSWIRAWYGHAMFIGNSQKEARYLSFPVFIAVRFIASKV